VEINLEDFFISKFKKSSKRIGDDCAYINGYVYAADAFNEGTHFIKNWLSYFEIGQKAMLVNLSDIIAMNAKPLYALTTVGFPANITHTALSELARGLSQTAKKYNCEIIGGDTVESEKLIISITCIGKTDNPLFRSGAKRGDFFAYTGTLGSSKKDLDKLLRNETISKNSKFIKPKIRDKFMYLAGKSLNCAIDISDGLYSELSHLSHASSVGIQIIKNLKEEIYCSGEEYELLVSFSAANKDKVLEAAKQSKTKLTIFAIATNDKKFLNPCKKHHFG
jgi:thiamine-monophosphate kinase